MLKNRSKAFAPKFKGGPRRTPGTTSSAQSSARPSVEPYHTHPPSPESSTKNVASSLPEQVTAPALPQEETERLEPNHPPHRTEKPEAALEAAPEARGESNVRNLKRKDREHDDPQLPAKRVPVVIAAGYDNFTATQSPLTGTTQEVHSQNQSRGDESLVHSAKGRSTRLTAGHKGKNARRAADDISGGRDNAVPSYNTSPSSAEPQSSILPTSKASINYLEPAPKPVTNPTIPESDTQAASIADGAQLSTSNSSQNDHEPPQFRYPTPPNTIPLSTVTLPIMGATTADATGLGPAGDTGALAQPGEVARISQIVPMAGLNPDGTAAALTEEPTSGGEKGKKKKKAVRRKKVQAAQEGDDVRATVDMQLNGPRRVIGQKRVRKKKDGEKKIRTRAQTPEGAEEEVVDHTTMKMVDLCSDLRIGKKFSKHSEIKERLMQKKVKAKMARDNPEPVLMVQDDREMNARQPDGGDSVLSAAPNAVVQMRVVDGQIVVDETTLQVDRQERGRAERGEVVEEVEEDDFTTVTTSGTFMKRERAVLWDVSATDLFYKGLAQFGTAFEMIAKLFPSRNRRQIKLKFNKEERNNPDKITRALTGEKVSINLEEYEKLAGFKLQDVEVIEAERAKIEQEQNAEEAKHAAELAENTRRKKADIQAKSDAVKRIASGHGDSKSPAQGTDSARAQGTNLTKENAELAVGKAKEASAASKHKKKAARKKNPHSSNTTGEEIEVLGSIET